MNPKQCALRHILLLPGEDVRPQPLQKRRELLESRILPKLGGPVQFSLE